jgi:hypothetical protein
MSSQSKTIVFFKHMLLSSVFVFQTADTLQFMNGSKIVDTWITAENSVRNDDHEILHTQKAKVSPDHKFFIMYNEEYHAHTESLITSVSLYTANKTKIWERWPDAGRIILFDLTNIYDDFVIMTTGDVFYKQPVMELIKDGVSRKINKKNTWHRIISYDVSANLRYIALHVKNPYGLSAKMWDHIHFIDLETNQQWTRALPLCVTCKRNRIFLEVDDKGITDVRYLQQHRIFSKEGELIDAYIKLEE